MIVDRLWSRRSADFLPVDAGQCLYEPNSDHHFLTTALSTSEDTEPCRPTCCLCSSWRETPSSLDGGWDWSISEVPRDRKQQLSVWPLAFKLGAWAAKGKPPESGWALPVRSFGKPFHWKTRKFKNSSHSQICYYDNSVFLNWLYLLRCKVFKVNMALPTWAPDWSTITACKGQMWWEERHHPSWLSPPQTLFFNTPAQLSHKSHWWWKHTWALLINVGTPRCLSFTPCKMSKQKLWLVSLHL